MKIKWSDRRQRTGIIISIAAFLVATVWILWPYQDNFSYQLSVNHLKPSEGQQLVEMNRETIVRAASFDTQPVSVISSKDEFIGSLKAPSGHQPSPPAR